jgi:ketosteroid isomerase-like protein
VIPPRAAAIGRRAFAASLLSVGVSAAASGAKEDEAAILRALVKGCDAFQNGDTSYLEEFLTSDFTLTDSSGVVTFREQNLDEVRRREPRYEIFRNHAMKVRLHGDAAIVTGITTVKGLAEGQPFAADFQFTDTLVRAHGRWKLAASHASRRNAS